MATANDLNISQAGYVVFDGTATFTGRTFQAGAGISLTNADGTSGNTTISATGAGTVTSITGDSGVTTSGAINLRAHTLGAVSGSTVSFVGASATELLFGVTDGFANTMIGNGAGSSSVNGSSNVGLGSSTLSMIFAGSSNTALGYQTLFQLDSGNSNVAVGTNSSQSLLSGSFNIAMGDSSLNALRSGTNNTVLGSSSGTSYTNAESSNILVGDTVTGVTGESNVIRIGNQGAGTSQQNQAFIAGIVGVTNANAQIVTVDSTTGQLGVNSASGSLVLIQAQTASNSASLNFTTGITGYDEYLLDFYGVVAATNDSGLTMNFSTDGGATYDTTANYNTAGIATSVVLGGPVQQSANGTTSMQFATIFGDGSASSAGSGKCWLFSLNSSTVNKTISAFGCARSATYGFASFVLDGEYVNSAVVNAFRLQMSAGNITTGTFKLYGVVN